MDAEAAAKMEKRKEKEFRHWPGYYSPVDPATKPPMELWFVDVDNNPFWVTRDQTEAAHGEAGRVVEFALLVLDPHANTSVEDDDAPEPVERRHRQGLPAADRPGWAVAWNAVNTPVGVLIGTLTAIVLLWGRLDDTLADMRGDLMNEFRTEIRALDERTQERFDVIERRLDRSE